MSLIYDKSNKEYQALTLVASACQLLDIEPCLYDVKTVIMEKTTPPQEWTTIVRSCETDGWWKRQILSQEEQDAVLCNLNPERLVHCAASLVRIVHKRKGVNDEEQSGSNR